MELAIGSNFDCTSRISGDGKFDQVDMDARALLKSSVVHLMEGIQRASAKVIKRRRTRTRLAVRVKMVSERKARLWAVLDLSEFSVSEREQMRDLAAGVTSEMYAPTTSQTIAEFLSRARSIEQVHADSADPDAASPDAIETATTVKRRALEKAAQELLPPHMQRVVVSCGAKVDANLVAKTIETVVENGRELCKALSKSRQEWEGLELKFGTESLVKQSELPSLEPVTQTTDSLQLQDAWVTAVDYFERVITLRLLADDRKIYVRYKDADHGHAIGEALLAAHMANQKTPEEGGDGVRFARVKVSATRQIPGEQKFVASSLEAIVAT